jgi:UDP-N-acetyl-D-glucosamine dehydrogenase
MTIRENLIRRLKAKTSVIGIAGLGYVGLPLALRFSEVGYRVVGIDVDADKVARLMSSRSYIEHIAEARVREARASGFEATTEFSRAHECDALILCVPTPLGKHREPDLSFVTQTLESLLPHMQAGQVLSLESTTWPGTTEEVLVPRLAQCGFKPGDDVFVVFSPEREDPGNSGYTTRTIPKVIGGYTQSCREVGEALYGQVVDTLVPVSSTRVAEMTKLLENIHRAVNIGLVNELKVVCHRMNIDIYEVIRAAATKPFGFTPYSPGPGLGGHCIPVDPFYLTWKAREFGLNTRFIELAGEVNTAMPHWVVERIVDALNVRDKALRGARILVLGIAYKKDVDDTRESPSAELMELLRARGARIEYSDPHVPHFPRMREHHFDLESVPLRPDTVCDYDCVLIATDHSMFDYDMLQHHAKLIVDSRGVYRESFSNVVRA